MDSKHLTGQQLAYVGRVALLALGLVLAACNAAGPAPMPTAAPPATVTVSGSGSVNSMIKYLGEAYKKNHRDLAFEFLSGSGTSGAVKGVMQSQLDLATMARQATSEEAAGGVVFVPIGTDKIVFATSQDAPVTRLSSQQIKDILTGKITNWSAVGGPNAAIKLFVREETEAATQLLREKLLGKEAFAESALVLTSAGDMNKALSESTQALGFLAQTSFVFDKPKARLVVVDEHDPANLSDSSYPFTRPVGVGYLPANLKLRPFIDFITSSEAKNLLSAQGIVPAK